MGYAIVVHAGAGYHSLANQDAHLAACADACRAAGACLKNGGTAVDAVEIAIKVLEDREITNAGYGSNLAIDGVVECDAVVVDQKGRSGAVGACPQIKNPVSLARLVLDQSFKQLTLRRVPPNLLVGQGAVEFASEIGVPVLPHDALVSPAALERWQRWRTDLKRAEKRQQQKHGITPMHFAERPPPDPLQRDIRENRAREAHTERLQRQIHVNKKARLSGTSGSTTLLRSPSSSVSGSDSEPDDGYVDPVDPAQPMIHDASANALINSTQNIPTMLTLSNDSVVESFAPALEGPYEAREDDLHLNHLAAAPPAELRAEDDNSNGQSTDTTPQLPPSHSISPMSESPPITPLKLDDEPQLRLKENEDDITDTVGAIALDSFGNIAAAASSGGIGMKHRGRMGPAALVGVGAAVCPIHPMDKSKRCSAAVTSGTGEHMSTTSAASKCAERVHDDMHMSRDGHLSAAEGEPVLRTFIEREFMLHPSVQSSNSAGAIGVVCLTKSKDGTYIHFAHNTDSFALASMSSDDSEPHCSMSRTRGNGAIADGARALLRKKRRGA